MTCITIGQRAIDFMTGGVQAHICQLPVGARLRKGVRGVPELQLQDGPACHKMQRQPALLVEATEGQLHQHLARARRRNGR
eukprot:2891484-Alexandrium_andersonii.AAC.1